MNYRCECYGCFLDPGEGRICEECRADRRRVEKIHSRWESAIQEEAGGQYVWKGIQVAERGVRYGSL